MIVEGIARMKALIDGLLAYSGVVRSEKHEVIDTGAVLQEVLVNLSLAISESKAQVVIGNLPTLRSVGGQFGQVFQNLVSNAIKYRSLEQPKIHVQAERQPDAWVFSVADN